MPWIKKEKDYQVHCLCGDCGNKLNETETLTGKELSNSWTGIVMGSGFSAGTCPNGCQPTFSDLNINTELKVWDVEAGAYHNKKTDEELFR